MKKTSLLLSCALFAASAAILPAPAASAENPFLDEAQQNTIEDLHKAITKFPYTWIEGNASYSIKFNANGTAEEGDFKYKWRAKNARQIELTSPRYPGEKAVLTFSADYTAYTGMKFDGLTALSGKQVTTPQP